MSDYTPPASSVNLASPGPIGGATPDTGRFTKVSVYGGSDASPAFEFQGTGGFYQLFGNYLFYRGTSDVYFAAGPGGMSSSGLALSGTGLSTLVLGNQTVASTATPISVSLGGTYATTQTGGLCKLKFFDDGVSADIYGFGITANSFNLHATDAAVFAWLFGDVVKASLSKTVFTMTQGLNFSTVGNGITYKSGTGSRAGNATLSGGTVTVTNTSVTANTVITLTRKTSGGTIGTAITYTLSAGASFTINSDNPLDTSVFSYLLVEVV